MNTISFGFHPPVQNRTTWSFALAIERCFCTISSSIDQRVYPKMVTTLTKKIAETVEGDKLACGRWTVTDHNQPLLSWSTNVWAATLERLAVVIFPSYGSLIHSCLHPQQFTMAHAIHTGHAHRSTPHHNGQGLRKAGDTLTYIYVDKWTAIRQS